MPKFIITSDNRKFDLSKAEDLGITTLQNHGVGITGVWKTKSGKVIVGSYSIWESSRHDGTCVGQSYHVADQDEIVQLAKEFGSAVLSAMIPVEE